MHFGITFPSYVDAWRDAEIAEANGFTHAWFYDSQLLYSDVYATMALVAEHTKRLVLGTLVAIPSNRIAPVTASAVATINALAPGRVILGLGTGFTGRNTMGLPAVPVADLVRYVEQVRGLLAGEDVLYSERGPRDVRERWIRLLHGERTRGFLNLDDPIPIHVAANGPKALAAVGAVGDGWITAGGAASVEPGLGVIAAAAREHGREFSGGRGPERPYTTALTTGCILRDGETYSSPRVVERVGPVAMVAMHAMWETARGGVGLGLANAELASAYSEYVDGYARVRNSPDDRRYLDVHEGHMVYLKPGEEAFVSEPGVRGSLTGPPDEVRQRVRDLATAGVDNLAIQVVGTDGRELIEEFGRHVIAKL
jgi:5,10-methylenetetrahydromethanopterin reductase